MRVMAIWHHRDLTKFEEGEDGGTSRSVVRKSTTPAPRPRGITRVRHTPIEKFLLRRIFVMVNKIMLAPPEPRPPPNMAEILRFTAICRFAHMAAISEKARLQSIKIKKISQKTWAFLPQIYVSLEGFSGVTSPFLGCKAGFI